MQYFSKSSGKFYIISRKSFLVKIYRWAYSAVVIDDYLGNPVMKVYSPNTVPYFNFYKIILFDYKSGCTSTLPLCI